MGRNDVLSKLLETVGVFVSLALGLAFIGLIVGYFMNPSHTVGWPGPGGVVQPGGLPDGRIIPVYRSPSTKCPIVSPDNPRLNGKAFVNLATGEYYCETAPVKVADAAPSLKPVAEYCVRVDVEEASNKTAVSMGLDPKKNVTLTTYQEKILMDAAEAALFACFKRYGWEERDMD
jgi:hypothetical protein